MVAVNCYNKPPTPNANLTLCPSFVLSFFFSPFLFIVFSRKIRFPGERQARRNILVILKQLFWLLLKINLLSSLYFCPETHCLLTSFLCLVLFFPPCSIFDSISLCFYIPTCFLVFILLLTVYTGLFILSHCLLLNN